jgi:hypothetical protein
MQFIFIQNTNQAFQSSFKMNLSMATLSKGAEELARLQQIRATSLSRVINAIRKDIVALWEVQYTRLLKSRSTVWREVLTTILVLGVFLMFVSDVWCNSDDIGTIHWYFYCYCYRRSVVRRTSRGRRSSPPSSPRSRTSMIRRCVRTLHIFVLLLLHFRWFPTWDYRSKAFAAFFWLPGPWECT